MSNLSLQEMISRAISGSIDKTASAVEKKTTDKKVKDLISYETRVHGHIPTVDEEEEEHKTASEAVTEDFAQKLASSVDWIAANLDKIDFPLKGVLEKAAESGSPVGPGKGPGALQVEEAMGGAEQNHRKPKPKTEDAAASQANTPLSTAGLPGSKTQISNNMHDAPGGGSVAPTSTYPENGPLASTLRKQAEMSPEVKEEHKRIARGGGRMGAASGALVGALGGSSPMSRVGGALTGSALGYGVGYGTSRLQNILHRAIAGENSKLAESPNLIAAAIMRKLAGEDVFKASINGGGTSSPLAGMGQLTSTDASQSPPSQAGGPSSGYGNQGRRLLQSNDAVINYTKGDAKGPQKTQLKEVLDEPALNPRTDTTLRDHLKNTGNAGVKIASARAALEKIASAGCTCDTINTDCTYCHMVDKIASIKKANAMMGYGGSMPTTSSPPMMSTANAGAGAEGCVCANAGECKVCKLKAALAAMKTHGENSPVEKDSTMEMNTQPSSSIY